MCRHVTTELYIYIYIYIYIYYILLGPLQKLKTDFQSKFTYLLTDMGTLRISVNLSARWHNMYAILNG